LGKSHACEGLLTTLFGITGHFTASIARTPSPLPKHYSIPNRAFFVNAAVVHRNKNPVARWTQAGFSQRG
jgi:hypothetical protein